METVTYTHDCDIQIIESSTTGFDDEIQIISSSVLSCGCCFEEFENYCQLSSCGNGHIFCLTCCQRASENVIGFQKTELKCLDSSGATPCSSIFSTIQAKRFLSETSFEYWMKLKYEKEMETLALPDYYVCPHCPFGGLVPADSDVFNCGNPECSKASCKLCKDEPHYKKSCEDFKASKRDKVVTDSRLLVEEAMSAALLRECGKCKKKFYKEEGCNKMTCVCGTLSCYVCGAFGFKQYDHFGGSSGNTAGKCKLWDSNYEQNESRVLAAGKKALAGIDNQSIIDSVKDIVAVRPKPEMKDGRDIVQPPVAARAVNPPPRAHARAVNVPSPPRAAVAPAPRKAKKAQKVETPEEKAGRNLEEARKKVASEKLKRDREERVAKRAKLDNFIQPRQQPEDRQALQQQHFENQRKLNQRRQLQLQQALQRLVQQPQQPQVNPPLQNIPVVLNDVIPQPAIPKPNKRVIDLDDIFFVEQEPVNRRFVDLTQASPVHIPRSLGFIDLTDD